MGILHHPEMSVAQTPGLIHTGMALENTEIQHLQMYAKVVLYRRYDGKLEQWHMALHPVVFLQI